MNIQLYENEFHVMNNYYLEKKKLENKLKIMPKKAEALHEFTDKLSRMIGTISTFYKPF